MIKKRLTMLFLIIVLCLSCFLSCLTTNIGVAYASTILVDGGYSSVLEDLQTDTDFNSEDYSVNAEDYSLQVIQIAESSDKELFVYVYQPSASYGKLVASSINISADLHNELNFKNYKLTLLNNTGVFYKYLVNDFVVSEDTTRYYEISSIFRPWDETKDAGLDLTNENIIAEISFKVAKQFTLVENNGETIISVADTETIQITDKYVGFVRYIDGFDLNFYDGGCDSHFVAFSTDKQIDKLYEADVYYTSQTCDYIWVFDAIYGGQETTYGNVQDNYAYLNYKQHASHTTNGIGGHYYEWPRIMSVNEFISLENRSLVYECGLFNVRTETNITDEGLKDLENKQWVLRFAETDYYELTTSSQTREIKTIVGDVTILRLKFETDGVVYNLGVIDNKQQGDENPDNETKFSIEPSDMFKIIMLVLLLIILLVVLGPFLPTIISLIFKLIKVIIKLILWLISLPFKLIKAIFKKRE